MAVGRSAVGTAVLEMLVDRASNTYYLAAMVARDSRIAAAAAAVAVAVAVVAAVAAAAAVVGEEHRTYRRDDRRWVAEDATWTPRAIVRNRGGL